jgi:tetratricopeptide (TPR) repeat protein
LAARQGKSDEAVAHLDKAVRLEDAMVYVEPADWHYPMRQSLGAVLVQAGRAVEAEVVYWEDLRRNPENGWSLFGLMQSLRAQGKDDQAVEIEKRFNKAWARADVKLTSSRF